jgi:tryptophan synthase alpha subunit
MIGFGISNHITLETVFDNASGAIVGSAFIKNLQPDKADLGIKQFMHHLLNDQ